MRIPFLLLVFAILSCTNQNKGKQILDFGSFSIEGPSEWKKSILPATDSYVGEILMPENDTIGFDFGPYSYDLTEYQEIKLGDGKTYYIDNSDTAYRPTLYSSADKYKVVKSKVTWDTIDGRIAKILSPINSGIGTTGIYIDSVWVGSRGKTSFNLYGKNLSKENEKIFLRALKTIKFHKR